MNGNPVGAAYDALTSPATNSAATNLLAIPTGLANQPASDYLATLVFLGAAVTTFVASVMADEQSDRLKNGTLGTLAGSALGGIAALLKNQQELLVVGFVGSAFGALLGWIAVLLLSYNARTPEGRAWLDYYVGGFKGLRDRLDLDDQEKLLAGLGSWVTNFWMMIEREKRDTLALSSSASTNAFIKSNLQSWLCTLGDVLALVFATLAKKPQYRSRVAIIVFGKLPEEEKGRIWLSHTGNLDPYRPIDLDATSIGWKVLSGAIINPHFTTKEEAKTKGQERGRVEYRPFYTFRLTNDTIFIMDWPEDIAKDDPFVQVATDLVKANLGLAMADLLGHWSGPIAEQVGLKPLFGDSAKVVLPQTKPTLQAMAGVNRESAPISDGVKASS